MHAYRFARAFVSTGAGEGHHWSWFHCQCVDRPEVCEENTCTYELAKPNESFCLTCSFNTQLPTTWVDLAAYVG